MAVDSKKQEGDVQVINLETNLHWKQGSKEVLDGELLCKQ